jgi:hypothetical protein
MGWKGVTVMDQRVRFISEYLDGYYPVNELCDQFSISRKTGYKWIHRYEKQGAKGFEDRSHRPHYCPHETDTDIIDAIVEARSKHPTWGPKNLLEIISSNHNDLAACPVHNCHKVAESFRHGNVRDVCGPDGIGFRHRKSSQKIGVDCMVRMRFREAGFLIDRLYPYFPHEGADMASAYLVALVPEFIPAASTAEGRVLQMNLVHETHERPILVAYRHRGVVDA